MTNSLYHYYVWCFLTLLDVKTPSPIIIARDPRFWDENKLLHLLREEELKVHNAMAERAVDKWQNTPGNDLWAK